MPLPSNFWDTGFLGGWNAIEMKMLLAGATIVEKPIPSVGYLGIEIKYAANTVFSTWGYTKDDFVGDHAGHVQSVDTGVFFGVDKGDGSVSPLSGGFAFGWPPHSPQAPLGGPSSPPYGWYTPPFVGLQPRYGGDSPPGQDGHAGPSTEDSFISLGTLIGSRHYRLHHWQPLTFVGTIAEVIGAILMYVGATADDIDTASFDDAYDDMILNRGHIRLQPFVWFRVTQGESVTESLKRIICHCSDFLTVNLAGKIALISRRVNRTSDLPVTSGDVIGATTIDIPLELITNDMFASHGQWAAVNKSEVYGFDPEFKADVLNEYFKEYREPNSVSVFGVRSWNTQNRTAIINGLEASVPSSEFPFYYYEEQKKYGSNRIEHNESKRRTMVKVLQGLIGLDYGIGFAIPNLNVNADAPTGPSNRCVWKRVDFNSLTVQSLIIQEYDEGHISDIGGIWDYLMDVPEPVGSVIEDPTNTMKIELATDPSLAWYWSLRAEIWKTVAGTTTKTPVVDPQLSQPPNSTVGDLLVSIPGQHLTNNEEFHCWIKGWNVSIPVPSPIDETPWRKMPVVSGSHP